MITALVLTGNLLSAQYAAASNEIAAGNHQAEISGELKKWHKVTITFEGPEASEVEEYNPFMNYRLNVLFTHAESGEKMNVPGYFAADGNGG